MSKITAPGEGSIPLPTTVAVRLLHGVMTFEGRRIAITGAASGIGRALAYALARRGSDVALCDINEDELAHTAEGVERLGRHAISQALDVSDREAVHAFADRVVTEAGRVDGIINNAGVALTDHISSMRYEDLEWIIGINLWGVIHGTKAFLPHLLERGDGWVVNLSSVFGLIAVPSQGAYNLTKFAVRGFTEALRQELEGTGVTALCVHPGGVKTNIARAGRHRDPEISHEDAADRFEKLVRTSPDKAASIIVNAMARRDPRVLVGPDAVAIDVVQRLMPTRYSQLFSQIEKRFRGE